MKLQIATLQPWVFPNNSRTIESDVENSTSILTSIMTTPKLPIFPLVVEGEGLIGGSFARDWVRFPALS